MEPPSYLKRCYKFPPRSLLLENRKKDDSRRARPVRRRHPMWGKAFELSVSFEALLKTKAASTGLFRFLMKDYHHADDDDEDEETDDEEDEEDEEYDEDVVGGTTVNDGYCYISKIVWMSDNIFAFAIPPNTSIQNFHRYFDQGACKVYSIDLFNDYEETAFDRVFVIFQPSVTTTTTTACTTSERAPVTSDAPARRRLVERMDIDGMDVLLRLVAKNKRVMHVGLEAHSNYGRDFLLGTTTTTTTKFPASRDALRAFVGEVRTARTVNLHKAGLSLEQWRMVTRNCSKKVTIELDYYAAGDDDDDSEIDTEMENERSAFVEAAILEHCPAKIKLKHLDQVPPEKRQLLLNALKSTTLLEELDILIIAETTEVKENFLFSLDTISRNRGYRRLVYRLVFPFGRAREGLTRAEWELLCKAITSHPTLQDLEVEYGPFSPTSKAIENDQMLIRMIRQNTVLGWVKIDPELLRNRYTFQEAIDPVLEFNRFRRVARAMKQEADPARRKRQFTKTLFTKPVCQFPAHRYLLLKENFDMLEQVNNNSTRRGRGKAIPSKNLEHANSNEINRHARKNRKRSRFA